MAAQERKRKSAPQNKVKSFQDAAKVIEPWVELDPDERRLFDAIIQSREIDTWLPADIESATQLAKVGVEMTRCWQQLQDEGRTIYTEKGWPAANPLIGTYSQLSGIYQKHRNSLGLSASQRGVSGNKQAARNQQDAKAANVSASKISSLIPRA